MPALTDSRYGRTSSTCDALQKMKEWRRQAANHEKTILNKEYPMHCTKHRLCTISFSIGILVAFGGCAHKESKPRPVKAEQASKPDTAAAAENPGSLPATSPAGAAPAVPDPGASTSAKTSGADAILKFASTGAPMHVTFEMSTSEEDCDGFKRIGRVFDSGRGVLLPWIAKMTEGANRAVMGTRTEVTRKAAGNQPVQIRGKSSWGGGSCGPITMKFIPEPSKSYLVEFAFAGNSACSQRVFDITDSAQKIAVNVQPVAQCSR